MPDLGSMLNNLFANDSAVSLEKTAEDNLMASLRGSNQVEENPYAQLSTEELLKIAQECESEEPTPDLLEKTAAEMLGGQVMAHSMVHELGLMKLAMAQGLCRVCKENPLDTEGLTICAACLSEE